MKTLAATKPFTGRHMLVIFLCFFTVVIGVNIFMAVMAIHSWTGLVVENSYVASQHFNSDVAALKKSAELGISHGLHYGKGKLQLSLTDAEGHPVQATNIQISFERAFGANHQQVLSIARLSTDLFEGSAVLSLGTWKGEISADLSNGDRWRQPFRLMVNGE